MSKVQENFVLIQILEDRKVAHGFHLVGIWINVLPNKNNLGISTSREAKRHFWGLSRRPASWMYFRTILDRVRWSSKVSARTIRTSRQQRHIVQLTCCP